MRSTSMAYRDSRSDGRLSLTRWIVVYLCLLAAVPLRGAWADAARWQPTTTGCLVWNALPQADESFEWSGPCVDGMATGQGTEVDRFRDSRGWHVERYVGGMREGKRDGVGTQYYENGDRFDGQFRSNERVGRGVYAYANGDRYEGDFLRDRITGRGSFTYQSGARYDGDFHDGRFDGQGTFVFADGSRYDGDFEDGLPNGQGTLRSPTGEVVSGHWSNGCLRDGERVAAAGTSSEKCGFMKLGRSVGQGQW